MKNMNTDVTPIFFFIFAKETLKIKKTVITKDVNHAKDPK